MPYSAKRLAEIAAERKARKKEKARLKKQKEREKKKQKNHERRLRLQRSYATKKRKKIHDERTKNGDEFAFFSVYITKNRKKVAFVGKAWWKMAAYKIYNEAIARNREKTTFKKTVFTTKQNGKLTTEKVKYEILLVKKTKNKENTVSSFRNEIGKYVDNVVSDWSNHIIVAKEEWFLEETFHVYGYNPYTNKQDYKFILNNLLLNDEDCSDNMKQVVVYKNKLIINYLNDFDFVTCYNKKQCEMLYNMLEKEITNLKRKYTVFMGHVTADMAKHWVNKIQEKTGWTKYKINHSTTRN